jgi:hypothetical protein
MWIFQKGQRFFRLAMLRDVSADNKSDMVSAAARWTSSLTA